MKQLLKKKGIVLTSRDYKENARVLTILTSEGLESSILRGANKINSKNKAFSLSPVLIEYVSSNTVPLSTLTEGVTVNNYTNIKSDSKKCMYALALIEKVLAFTENIDNKPMFFNFVSSILEKLETTNYPDSILNLFEIKLMYLLGIAPIVNHCMICQKPKEQYVLSLKVAGVVCNDCKKNIEYELDENQTKVYQYLYLIKLEKVDENFLQLINKTNVNLSDWIDKYYERYIDFYSKTKKIIKKVAL